MEVVSDQRRVSTGLGAKDGGGGWTRTLCGGGITVHLVVSPDIKVHGTEYAHPITHSHTHTHMSRCDRKSKMVDGCVGIEMETLSSSSAGPFPLGERGQSADSISPGCF